jgi:hypothetical protein
MNRKKKVWMRPHLESLGQDIFLLFPSFFDLLTSMSLLFDIAQSVDVSFTVKTLPDKHGVDTVLVSKDIWRRFEQLGHDRVALSIRPVQSHYSGRWKEHPLKELTCWAVLDEDVGFCFCFLDYRCSCLFTGS